MNQSGTLYFARGFCSSVGWSVWTITSDCGFNGLESDSNPLIVKLVEPHKNKTTTVIVAADYNWALASYVCFAISTNISMDSLDNEKFYLNNSIFNNKIL